MSTGQLRMNDAWIDEQLKRWGEFSSGRDTNGIGYPSQCPTFRVDDARATAGSLVLVDSNIMRIDRIIAALGRTEPELFDVAFCWYVFALPVSSCARRCHCTERTVYRRLEALKRAVDVVLR